MVAKGHTLGKIAARYHVDVDLLAEINGLSKKDKIRPGLELVIPKAGREAESRARAGELRRERERAENDKALVAKKRAEAKKYTKKPAHPGRVTFKQGTRETSVQLGSGGTVRPAGVATLKGLLGHRGGSEHDISPKLAKLLVAVSDHFGGRPLVVVSGYRPATAGSHSNHHAGRAVDFRVEGVPNSVVRDFCLTLDGAGVGYYPNSTFVHLDTRAESFAWVDRSGPGEAPRYESMGAVLAAEGGSAETLLSRTQPIDLKAGNKNTSGTEGADTPKVGSKRPSPSDGRQRTHGKKKPEG